VLYLLLNFQQKKLLKSKPERNNGKLQNRAAKPKKAWKATMKSDIKRKEAAVVPPKSSVVADVVRSLVKVTLRGEQ